MFKMELDYTKSKEWLSTMLILRIPLKLLVRSEFLPNFSDMLNLYVYVLFGSLLFVVILAAARALGADFLHHDILDHSVDAGIREVSLWRSHQTLNRTGTFTGPPPDPATRPGSSDSREWFS